MRKWARRRLVHPVLELLKQGITPEKIALSLAFGLVLGVFPALGWTTLLCLAVALSFRLNIAAMQLVNYFVYPVQLALLVPFLKAGAWLFGTPALSISIQQILALVKTNLWHAITALWVATMHAIVVWALLAPPAVWLIYRLLLPLLQRLENIHALRKRDKVRAGENELFPARSTTGGS